jgi:hypothetical protein
MMNALRMALSRVGGVVLDPSGRRLRTLALIVVSAMAAACGDSGPSGPGLVDVRVVPPPSADAGAVVVELAGEGIEGFEAAGGARVFGAPRPGVENVHRAVVIVDQGELVFRVRLTDIARLPQGVVIQAVDRQNRTLPGLTAFEVRFSR